MINPVQTTFIEEALLGDIDEMDRIEQEAFSTPWSRELLRAAVLNDQYQVRVLRCETFGLLGFYIAHDVKGKSNLDNLVVDAWARGRGHGSDLLSDWIGQAKDLAALKLTLQVNTSNRKAQSLYEHFEFKTTRLLVSYYPNGEDAYQMVRDLESDDTAGQNGTWEGVKRLRRALIG